MNSALSLRGVLRRSNPSGLSLRGVLCRGNPLRALTTALLLALISVAFSPATTGCSGGPGSTDPALSASQKATVYYIDDHLGSAQLMTDGEGNIVYEGVTAPYGLDLDGLASTEVGDDGENATGVDYSYTTKERDDETGLVYFGKRYYSPDIGRWITPDPKFIGDPGQVAEHPLEGNLYSYVRNSPLGYVDPDGYGAWAVTGGAFDVFSGVPDSWYPYGGNVLDMPVNLLNGAINAVGYATYGVDKALGYAGTNMEEVGISMMMIPGAGSAVGGSFRYMSSWIGARISNVGRLAGRSTTTALQSYFPTKGGVLGQINRKFLYAGERIDRYGGSDMSRFFSPKGIPMKARSLPPGTASQPLRTFEILKPFEVESGTVAPAFGEMGLGVQYRTPVPMKTLLDKGIIQEVAR